ncbi:hypothetical protein ACFL2S_07925 [Thermodesulfobacteriota bacterium]|jgi:hypothetical protein
MTDTPHLQSLMARPAVYRIRITGRMDQKCSDWLQGMTISTVEEEGRTAYSELIGSLPDQAALMGVLQQLNNCSISVISMECLGIGSLDE